MLDLAAREIVGWAMRDHLRTEPLPATPMMVAAQRRRPTPGLIRHSDRGSQHVVGVCVGNPAVIDATPSMYRAGNCYENAPIESLFHILKVEFVHRCRWATPAEGGGRCSDTTPITFAHAALL
jgi:transposase InsO family protein